MNKTKKRRGTQSLRLPCYVMDYSLVVIVTYQSMLLSVQNAGARYTPKTKNGIQIAERRRLAG